MSMDDEIRRAGQVHVPEESVPDDERMSPVEFRAVREYLGLTEPWLAARLGVTERTVRHWQAGKYPIPDGVRVEMEQLEGDAAQQVGELVGGLVDEAEPLLRVPADEHAGWPARWWRHVAIRVAVEVPGLVITEAVTES